MVDRADRHTFDVIVSNLCIHNIYDAPTNSTADALHQIVRVLKPGGMPSSPTTSAPPSMPTSSATAGLIVEKKRGSLITTFPPLTVIIARKPM